MPDIQSILTRVMAVYQSRGPRGDVIFYSPEVIEDQATERIPQDIRPPRVKQCLMHIRRAVAGLLTTALRAHPRTIDIEPLFEQLAALVLPKQGFREVFPDLNVHPQLDLSIDISADIPWESLVEKYLVCSNESCDLTPINVTANDRHAQDLQHCSRCGKSLQLESETLAIKRHVAHLVRGERTRVGAGDAFLIVQDPTCELTAVPFDQTSQISNHFIMLEALLREHGYRIRKLAGKNATRGRFLEALREPELVGVYYFGHGMRGLDGALLLNDEPVSASEIKEQKSAIRFAFINACEGGATPANQELERPETSIGAAFAQGSMSKVAVAPIWPIVTNQAAEAALEFFNEALGGANCGEALQRVRKASLARYRQREPDLSWMAYRFFGDLNLVLNAPHATPTRVPPTRIDAPREDPTPLPIDSNGFLDLEAFDFDMDGVLVRASKRRLLQRRRRITCADLLCGLIRVAPLTRFLWSNEDLNPDESYDSLRKEIEAEVASDEAPDAERGFLELDVERASAQPQDFAWMLRLIEDWAKIDTHRAAPEIFDLLREAANLAAEDNHEDDAHQFISEKHILLALTQSGRWKANTSIDLPSAAAVSAMLGKPDNADGGSGSDVGIDRKGHIDLRWLDLSGRRVIDATLAMAQQRGVRPIPNRLLLAAFLADDAFSTLTPGLGRDSLKLIAEALVASTVSAAPLSFDLTIETCQGAVLNTLCRARESQREQGGNQRVDFLALFAAFLFVMPSALKKAMRSLPGNLQLDLDAISLEYSGDVVETFEDARPNLEVRSKSEFSSAADRLAPTKCGEALLNAAEYATLQGHTVIRSPHLFAGALSVLTPVLHQPANLAGCSIECAIRAVLSRVPPQEIETSSEMDLVLSESAERLVQRARDAARVRGVADCDPWDLLRSLVQDEEGVVVRALRCANQLDFFRNLLQTNPTALENDNVGVKQLPVAAPVVDLTARAARGQLPNIVGRDREIRAMLEKLSQADGHAPLLVGKKGVGKTAIVDGAAAWLHQARAPSEITGVRLIEVSGRMLASAARFLEEVERFSYRLVSTVDAGSILFIDDLHECFLDDNCRFDKRVIALLTAPGTRWIGAFDADAYAQLRKRPLLESMDVISVEPPSAELAQAIILSHLEVIELEYNLSITPNVLKTLVAISAEQAPGIHLPLSAMTLLHRACRSAAESGAGSLSEDALRRSYENESA